MYKIALSQIDALFSTISQNRRLYLPVERRGGSDYALWEEGTVWSTALNTVRSAKDFFFPQTENLMSFKTEGKRIEVIDTRSETEDFVIFGARACDVRSFEVLDRVFLADPVDTFYQNRRAHALIFSLACTKPAETCFCTTFGIDPASPEGDVVCYRTEDTLYLTAGSERGASYLASLSCLSEESDTAAVDAQKKTVTERVGKLPLHDLRTDAFGGDKTKDFFNDPAWKTLSEACLGCGTCTFVCPTCQCYDIKDFNTGKGIQRFRCWDSCMYSGFTKMSAGQPRLTQLERFRQRFMHKLVYYPANNDGMFGCVGCGRCLSRCPIKMNIVKVMKTLSKGGEQNG